MKRLLLLFVSLFLGCAQLSAATILPTDIATSCERPEDPDIVFRCGTGSVGSTLVDDWEAWGSTGPYISKSAIEFSIANVNLNPNSKAELHFNLTSNTNSYVGVYEVPQIEIHGYAGDGSISYDALNTENWLLTSQPLDTLGWYVFDVTDFVKELDELNKSFAGFTIRGIVPNSSALFYSSTEVTTIMVISTVPLPASVWLFCSGMFSLLALTKRKYKM